MLKRRAMGRPAGPGGTASPPGEQPRDPGSVNRAWLRLAWPYLIIVPLLVLVATAGMLGLSSGRALQAAESRWILHTNNAILYLSRYVESCDPTFYQRYRQDLLVPQAYGKVRLEMLLANPDPSNIFANLKQVGNQDLEMPGISFLVRHFKTWPLPAVAILLSQQAHQLLVEIDQLSQALDVDLRASCNMQAPQRATLAMIYQLYDSLMLVQTGHAEVLDQINRRLLSMVLAMMTAAGLLLALLGVIRSLAAARAMAAMQRLAQAELDLRRSAHASLRGVLGVPAAVPADQDLEVVNHAVVDLARLRRADHEALTTILRLSPDAFVSFGAANTVDHVSPAFETVIGLAASEVLGLDEAAFIARLNHQCTPLAGLPAFSRWRQAEPGAPALLALAGAGQRLVSADLWTHEGAGCVLSLRDVTREHELERLKGVFMTTAAHELRTPMASIFGFVELMQHRKMSDERRAELLAIVHRQSRLMISIIDDLMDLSRLEARRGLDTPLQPLDLAGLVQATVAAFEVPAGREPVQLPTLPTLPTGLVVTGDRDKLTRVLINLLTNAYKYSPGGGAVSLSLPQATGPTGAPRVGLCVQDRGIGMTAGQLQRVGERFYRADSSGNIPGTGLGMSIVREIVQLHGGEVQLDSRPGEGTRATVWLPLAA